MQPSLALQLALFRHQQRQIDALVSGASSAFKSYEARYRRASTRVRAALSMGQVYGRVREADVVYVGDYHTLRYAQRAFLDLVSHAGRSGRRLVLALEFVEARHQTVLERYLAGRLSDRRFLEGIGHPYSGAFDIWPHFKPIFELARREKLEVIAIDKRASGPRSLAIRDEVAAKLIAKAAKAEDRPLVLALVGQYHVAPAHLPACVTRALGTTRRRQLVVFQNPEGAWWRLARAGKVDVTDAVEHGDDVVGVFNASPVVCQRTFLDYCEAEAGDAPIEDGGMAATVRALARAIGRLAGVPVTKALARLEVLTPLDLDGLERIGRRGQFSRRELEALRRHALSGQSAFVPRARTIWLSGFSLNHAAEEAAHFVRHCATGAAMERDRPWGDAFWARAVEEAIGFFGSKLVNPKRTCPTLDEWASHFRHGSAPQKQTAAFVLALTSLPDVTSASVRRLLPTSSEQFNAVSHAIGYLLGEALYQAHRAGRLDRAQLRALFTDPIVSGPTSYARWAALSREPLRRSG
ncbi:MAG: ChaN family lipoprotein [Myxococcaceae bacterium]|nr:ChaN family lipoprotein [Myxococcaceae bacterium]